MDYDLILVAGEPSGDEHASHILEILQKEAPHLKIAAVSGPKMKQAFPHKEILGIETLSVMGFIGILKHLPRLFKAYYQIFNFILNNPAKLVLFVDYPGMNLKLMTKLKKKGYKGTLWHFIAPTAWAWKPRRIETLKQYCDHLFCILPFEESFFRNHGVKATYVGHPLMTKLKKAFDPIHKTQSILAIFPGSRKHEIENNLPRILASISEFLIRHPDLKLQISIAQNFLKPTLEKVITKTHFLHPIEFIGPDGTLQLMKEASYAIAKSGTCNLELALLGTPSVIVYAISRLDLWIAQKVFKINLPYYSLPNLLLNREMLPELYGPYFTEKNLLTALEGLTFRNQVIKEETQALRTLLGTKDPGAIVAEQIMQKVFFNRHLS